MLKKYKDPEYGFTQGDVICVNIQKIWEETQKVDDFTDIFGLTYTHDFLHLLIPKLANVALVWEEKIIRSLLDEKWNKELEQKYLADEFN